MNINEIKDSTLFVVDDNKENLNVLVQYLSDLNLNAVPIRSGEEALKLVKTRIPDMILLDIMMPGGIDGYETCRRLKANKATKDIPVIFMSALTDTFDKVAGFNLGAVDYITKPIETEELLSRIHTHLSVSRLQKKLFEMNAQLEEKVLIRTEDLRKSNLQLRNEIEEHKKTEESLRQSEKKYRELQDNVPVGVFRSTPKGKFVSVNSTLTNMLGYNSSDELLQTDIINIYATKEDRKMLLDKADKEGVVYDYECQAKRKDDSKFWVSISLRMIYDANKNKKYYDGIIVDITERKQVMEQIKVKNKFLDDVFEAITHPFYIVNVKDYTIAGANKVAMADKFREGITCHELTHHSSVPCAGIKHVCPIEIIKKTKKPSVVEHLHYDKNGEEKNVEVYSYPIFDKMGSVIQMIEYSLDITERKQAEETMKIQAEIMSNMSEAVYLIRMKDGIIVYTNEEFERMFGFASNEMVGKHVSIVNAPTDKNPEETAKEIMAVLAESGKWEGEVHNIKKDGTTFWCFAKVTVFEHPHYGEVLLSVHRDITERKRAEKELIKAKLKAEESDKLKSSFLENMSHEVRTPMNGIMGFSQFLKDPDLSHENKVRYINIINESCHQLLAIVEDIMEISKLETDQIEIVNKKFDATEIVDAGFNYYKDKCDQRGIELIQTLEIPDTKKLLYSDKDKTSQILNKLLNNAVKFTQEGKIEIGARYKTSHIEFFVRDTGIGIDSEIKEKIFERFRQAETDMSRTYGGTGLGLAITKGYIDLMQGDVWVDSELGSGSTFYFTIPYQKIKAPLTGSEIEEVYEPIISFNEALVLIAEDEEINYQYIKRVFNGIGIENIIRAFNGSEAVDICEKRNDIDLVMMDLKMPIMNGFEATRKIKSRNKNIPVIAQTALAIPGDEKKALEAGCDDYISKPIDYDKLLTIIENYIKFK